MVFLQRTTAPPNPRKRPAAPLADACPPGTTTAGGAATSAATSKGKAKATRGEEAAAGEQMHVATMISLLAEAGCTLRVPHGCPPSLPADSHKLRRHLESRLAADASLRSQFLSGFSSYIQNPQNFRRVLIPASQDHGSGKGDSLVRNLLLVAHIQPHIQDMILEKLPEYFDASGLSGSMPKDDVARLIVNQFRWLDFLVDAERFTGKLMEVLSICPPQLKKEIIGSLPEIIGDQSHGSVVSALELILQEDSEVIVPVLDSFSNLNLDEQLHEQVVMIALSCIRTVDREHMPHLLRFLLLSATPINVRRIISQIREQLKFVGVIDSYATRDKKLKGKSSDDSMEALIVDSLRSSLRFKNVLCEAILKELKYINHPQDHKAIDVWLLMLIYMNGSSMQKCAEKILKTKVIEGCFSESLFNQCIHGHRELVKDYFPSFLSLSEYLLACKEHQASKFGIHLYTKLFEEFHDTYLRQEVLGGLVTHIGSGVRHEVSSALEAMVLLASKYPKELIHISSHISGILDYLEGFDDHNLHKVYKVFCHLALFARANADSLGSSFANELLMIVRKQISNPDMKYRKMGIIGTLKIVSSFGDANNTSSYSTAQKCNSDEAIELLKLSMDSCKLVTLALVLLYDELIMLLECKTLQPAIIDWIGKHVGEFESTYLSDLEGGQLPIRHSYDGLEGELWMNLDGDLSPVCLNILPLLSSSLQQCSSSLQILPSEFSLLSAVERITNQGSLGGIDALLGCPLHLPSSRYFIGAKWKRLAEKQKQVLFCSIFFAMNWIRELLNAFCTQIVAKVNSISQATRDETLAKVLKRLRNLVFMEGLLNACLKFCPISLPELNYIMESSGSPLISKLDHAKQREKSGTQSTSPKKKHKQKKGLITSEDPNGKLKQPTIVDVLKRAGAVVSQEVLDRCSSGPSSNGKMTQDCGDEHNDSENELVDIAAAPIFLEPQRFKSRPLCLDCLSVLTFLESQDPCCSDPAAELSLHLYLLRDLRAKLEDLNSPTKAMVTASPVKGSSGVCKITISELLTKIRPLFASLRKDLDAAVFILKQGSDTCEDHWKFHSTSAANPDIPHLVVSKTSVANSVFQEVLLCYSRLLCLPDLFLQTNLPVLRDMLEAFHPTEKADHFLSGLQPLPTPGNIDYLYCHVYSFFEGVMDTACSFSFMLAFEVLITLQSLVNSVTGLVDKYVEGIGKTMCLGYSNGVLPFLRSRLGLSARKLLNYDAVSDDDGKGSKRKADNIQMVLQIYLRNSESALDVLNELACSVLPQIPSGRTANAEETSNEFPTLHSSTFPIWYRVLHEENLGILNRMVKEVSSKSRRVEGEAVEELLRKLRQTVNTVVSLVNMCKVHDKVVVHAMAIKHGGKYVESFLKVFDFLQTHFQAHNDIILQTVKDLQKATRVIQTLCSEGKGSKRLMITSKVPATKRTMERFLFHVKGLLYSTSSNCTFWMGNLKHKDLFGQVVSSQVYANEDHDIEQEKNLGDDVEHENKEPDHLMDEDLDAQEDDEI